MANNDNSSCASYIGCFISLIITFLMIGGVGYCTYKEHYYDYPAEIADAINDHDFERAHELLVEMKDNHRYQSHWFNNEGYETYLATYNKLMQAEISYLVNEKDQSSADRLISFISEYPILAEPSIGPTHNHDIIKNNDVYNAKVGKFNGYCEQILQRAINTRNRYLAESIIMIFKPILGRVKVDTHFLGEDEYEYYYDDSPRERAQMLFDQAFPDESTFENN